MKDRTGTDGRSQRGLDCLVAEKGNNVQVKTAQLAHSPEFGAVAILRLRSW
ncbi:hypothetical protein [Mesorhizobium muleiense]|uniref:hypothetical protein n=1 Tax=Mesorhizobium muleiense TaxID=1004279 RepID=UPI001F3ECA9F|nr:hypothetical protein [Mesorhizobium muleiense]MCF6112234.1 hypothetical protein [Mesorhizobium muleiense]